MADKSPKAQTPQLPATFKRFTKALLAVPAQEIAEQKAKYEAERAKRPSRGRPPDRA